MRVPSLPETGAIADALLMAEEISQMRGRPLLTILTGTQRIDHDLLEEVYVRLPFRRFEQLDVLLDAPGGDAWAAVGIAELLQRQARRVVVLVPRYARSAATILALGASGVELGPIGQLGPIDPQVDLALRRERGGSVQLELALPRELRRVSEELARSLDEGSIEDYAAESLVEAVARTVGEELTEQLSLVDQARSAQLLQATERAAAHLLRHSGRSGERAAEVARQLARGLTDHGYFLGLHEARELDLPVMGLEEHVAFFGYMAASTADQLEEPLVRLVVDGKTVYQDFVVNAEAEAPEA